MITPRRLRPLFAASLLLTLVPAHDALAEGAAPVAQIFALPQDFYPESIDVARDGTFYIGSWRQGAVARLKPGDTKAEIFVTPGSNGLTNGQGVLVDEPRNTLWVCSGNLGYTTVPRHESSLKSYDLASGAPKRSYAFPSGGYCNDLALDGQGRLYVTDSFHPRILRLEAETSELRPWAEDPSFCLGSLGFCLNGVAIDPHGAVYVGLVEAAPYLLKVPVDAQGEAGKVGKLAVDRILKNADGLRFLAPDRILIFESNAFAQNDPLNGSVTIATLGTGAKDGTASLRTVMNGLSEPSSGTVFDGRIYVIQSKYPILLRHKPDETSAVPLGVPFAVESRSLEE
jgi:sugar lactone lactonase YvrE